VHQGACTRGLANPRIRNTTFATVEGFSYKGNDYLAVPFIEEILVAAVASRGVETHDLD